LSDEQAIAACLHHVGFTPEAHIAEVVITAVATTANISREGFDEAGSHPKTGWVSRDQL